MIWEICYMCLDVSRELVECLYYCFPEQIAEIQQNIKVKSYILKFVIFPEEFLKNMEAKNKKKCFCSSSK